FGDKGDRCRFSGMIPPAPLLPAASGGSKVLAVAVQHRKDLLVGVGNAPAKSVGASEHVARRALDG
ncbi:hypothetical protein ACTHSJ_33880, partial [Paenibacillus cellulositrophicus]|uniref:hypothetical protein n=1 Tax=Paenibacillus cellulositrophicus TaxID=562959 RepID=UPI003F7F860C